MNQKFSYQFFDEKQQFFFCVFCDIIFSSIFANNIRKRVRFETKSNFEITIENVIKRRKIRQQSIQQTKNLRRRRN